MTFLKPWYMFLISVLFLTACSAQPESAPFAVTLDHVAVENGNQLSIVISIDNVSQGEYEDVTFHLVLNEEMDPYIASHVLEFTSAPTKITTQKKALNATADNVVWGYNHHWNMPLSSVADFQNSLSQDLKTLTVELTWNGGTQVEVLPLQLTDG